MSINGNAARGTGILFNELYGGRLVWNKVRMVKDPDTGRRVSRVNPRETSQIVEVPQLAIVSAELFTAVQNRKQARAHVAPAHQKRPRYLLSGLHREMREPALLAEFVRAYHAERQRLAKRATADRQRLERRLAAIDREAEHVIDMLVKRIGHQDRLSARSHELAAEEAEVRRQLAEAPEAPTIVALHPQALARYEIMLGRLSEALNAGIMTGDTDGADALRNLVDTATVRPNPERRGGVEVEISGRLNALLGDEAYPHGVREVWGSMVAREGFADVCYSYCEIKHLRLHISARLYHSNGPPSSA